MVEIKIGQVYEDVYFGGTVTILGEVDNAEYEGSLPVMRHVAGHSGLGVTNLIVLGRFYKLREESND